MLLCGVFLPFAARGNPVVTQYRTLERPGSVYLGTECFSGGATPAAALSRLGVIPLMRTALNRWSEIETSPGVYDWSRSHLDQVVSAHRAASEAVVPIAVAAAVPAFYPSSITNPTTRAAALAFMSAYVNTGAGMAGSFIVAVDPRVQETVFTTLAVSPNDWASLFVDLAGVVHSVPGLRILTDLVGDNHSSYLPGSWLTTVAWVADGMGIEETAPLVSTVLSDVTWFYGRAAGTKVWILGTSFSTWTGVDVRAHGTETEQLDYFWSLLQNLASNYGSQVQACVQISLADAGTASTWDNHLGVSTPGVASDKPAMSRLRQYESSFPAYHTIYEHDRSAEIESGTPFDLGLYSLTDFDYLEWKGTIDLSQVTAVQLTFNVGSSDGYPGFLLQAGGAWRQIASSKVNIMPWVSNGRTTLRLFAPEARLPGVVEVTKLSVLLDINPALPDVYPPLVDNLTMNKWINLGFTDDLDAASAASLANYVLLDPSGRTLPIAAAAVKGTRTVRLSVQNQKAVTYKLIVSGVRDDAGNAMSADTLSFKGVPPSGPGPTSLRPYDLSLSVAPDGIKLHMEIAEGASGPVRLTIFDVSGRRVRSVPEDDSPERSWSWTWTGDTDAGSRAPSGIYFVRAEGARGSAVARCTLR